MPRVDRGRSSDSLARQAMYRVQSGTDQVRVDAMRQHSLSSALSDGSQVDSWRVEVVRTLADRNIAPQSFQLTTGQTTSSNAEGDIKTGGQQQSLTSAEAYYQMKAEQTRDVEVAPTVTAPLAGISTEDAMAEHASLRPPVYKPPPPKIVYTPPPRPPGTGAQEF